MNNNDIAIVGVALKLKETNSLDGLWDHLVNNRCFISEITEDRWNYIASVDKLQSQYGLKNKLTASLLPDVDAFDAPFFSISRREAELMDPQQRIALELSWRALEDAGIAPSSVAGSRVGVYMGVCNADYLDLIATNRIACDPYIPTGTAYSIIANRISYWYDFKGPSVVNDSACASSLVSIYQAVTVLRKDEIPFAIAGAVNICWSFRKFIEFSQNGMLSKSGECNAFDQSADGFVRGEGGVIFVLKKLSKAVEDNDSIHAVIKGIAINHGGRSGGLTITNPEAQGAVIREALHDCRWPPNSVTYVEAHGPGTPLGDPIEINGLKRGYLSSNLSKEVLDGWSCGIGSVKTNYGHLESASGILGVAKAIVSMKKGCLLPTHNFNKINPVIRLKNSPFYIVAQKELWDAEKMSGIEGCSRRAGVSSFGFGGVNAHVVLEEYIEDYNNSLRVTDRPIPIIVLLSAKSEQQLRQQAQSLLIYIETNAPKDEDLVRMAYTLQVGREAMEERLALSVASTELLIGELQKIIEDKDLSIDCYRGSVSKEKELLSILDCDDSFQETVQKWIARGKVDKLLALWVKGLAFDWNKLYGEKKPQRISLPTYPFAKERYWIEESYQAPGHPLANATMGQLHPLLHQNTSTSFDTQFTSTFMGNEFFFKDHQVQDKKVLPGVGHLEMARVAIGKAYGVLPNVNAEDNTLTDVLELTDVVWLRPVTLTDETLTLHISVDSHSDTEAAYDIYSVDSNDEETLYSQGCGHWLSGITQPTLGLERLRLQCRNQPLTREELYQKFREMGLSYGPGHQCIVALHTGVDDGKRLQVLATLCVPEAIQSSADTFGLHPGLLDSALQAAVGLSLFDSVESLVENVPLSLPFALASMTIYSALPDKVYAWIRYSDDSGPRDEVQKLEISVCDEQGLVCADLKGFSSRVLTHKLELEAQAETVLYTPVWQTSLLQAQEMVGTTSPLNAHRVLLIGAFTKKDYDALTPALPGPIHCQRIGVTNGSLANLYQHTAAEVFTQIQTVLAGQPREPTLVQVLIQEVKSLGTADNKPEKESSSCLLGLSGLLKTASQENPKLFTQCIQLTSRTDSQTLVDIIQGNARDLSSQEIRYIDGDKDQLQREVKGLREVTVDASVETEALSLWRNHSVTLITGGVGGLGFIMAQSIAEQTDQATVILSGRSVLDDQQQIHIDELRACGLTVDYQQTDIADRSAVQELFAHIHNIHGDLTGIIHSAGVTKDNYILKKTAGELKQVLAPKVAGLINLDEASQDLTLEHFVCFSSVTGALGNPGQADYAAANGFMDAYAHERNRLVEQGKRYGRTLSISWPLWEKGGMQVDTAVQAKMRQQGLSTLSTEAGLKALARSVESDCDQVLVLSGNRRSIAQLTTALPLPAVPFSQHDATPSGGDHDAGQQNTLVTDSQYKEKALGYFKQQLSLALKLRTEQLDVDAPLENYGMDSVMAMDLTRHLEETFGSLSKTLFFEVQTVRALNEYFITQHAALLQVLLGESASFGEASSVPPVTSGRRRTRTQRLHKPLEVRRDTGIAIIGISGRYPQANNLREYWDNLKAGKDCITEIPASRWDHSQYFDSNKNAVGKSYSKWGGFIDGVDQFDPLFFNISPREAALIDPQERLFLQCVYETIEDAGYTRASLTAKTKNGSTLISRNVGVFVGVMYEEYQLYGAQAQILGQNIAVFGNPSSIANRVSYFCNFHGPSLAVDTMCSSSLTAIHLALQSIVQGGCEIAIAGGVNVSIHPNKYLALSQGKFISSVGRCESFGEGGDGYVPAEGVGAILLKPKVQAIADNDQIYGLIRGAAINHGGKTNGYSVPNPLVQGQVIEDAIKNAGVTSDEISYIEAHGTGTSLGDPIEIAGLSRAFQSAGRLQDNSEPEHLQYCSIGSVKSNIGHLESAAGIAGVTKVLLQMKHGQIVPSLHSETLNPNIDFSKTPFKVQQTLESWERPRLLVGGEMQEVPRIAGISSFGAGGSNAHIIVEEYTSRNFNDSHIISPTVILLSARNHEQLKKKAEQLIQFIGRQKLTDAHLSDIGYTLQVGREAMDERFSMVAENVAVMIDTLTCFIEERFSPIEYFNGSSSQDDTSILKLLSESESESESEIQEAYLKWIKKKQYNKLADLWVRGFSIDWSKLYEGEESPRRISLPTYPFSTKKYWIEIPKTLTKNSLRKFNTIKTESNTNKKTNDTQGIATVSLLPPDSILGASPDLTPKVNAAKIKVALTSLGSEVASQDIQTFAALKGIKERQVTSLGLPHQLRLNLADTLSANVNDIDWSTPFIDLGLDSVIGVEWMRSINSKFSLNLQATILYEHDTIYQLSGHIESLLTENKHSARADTNTDHDKITSKNETKKYINANKNDSKEFIAEDSLPSIYIKLREGLADVLYAEFEEIKPGTPFIDLGLDSVVGVEWARWINSEFGLQLQATVLYEHTTIEALAAHIVDLIRENEQLDEKKLSVEIKNSHSIVEHASVSKNTIGSSVDGKKQNNIDDKKEISFQIRTILSNLLLVDLRHIDTNKSFVDLEVDSIIAVEWIKIINERYLIDIPTTAIYDFHTVEKFATYIVSYLNDITQINDSKSSPSKTENAGRLWNSQPIKEHNFTPIQKSAIKIQSESLAHVGSEEVFVAKYSDEKIAIVGASGRYPGAENLRQFWENLQLGISSVFEVPKTRWNIEELYDADLSSPGKINCKWLGAIENIDRFDPLFFNISPAEAELMDPQHRLFLEESYKTFEDAGYSAQQLDRVKCGVYFGIMNNDYSELRSRRNIVINNTTGTSGAIGAARIAYHLNLMGPAIAIDTACSSSLVATHMAIQALQRNEVDMALAGAATLYIFSETYISMCNAGMLSADGNCKSFDNNADGFVPGEGVGAILLKRLSDAQIDGDSIRGTIIASGTNQDGKTNGITAPSMQSQTRLLEDVYRSYGIDPSSVNYIEAHGTGTKLGDPIELAALSNVFSRCTAEKQFCALGSVKSNIGHTSAAAGLAGMHKVLLCMEHQKLVPSLHFNQPNEHFDFKNSPFYVNTQLITWVKKNGLPRRAGVSSFGFSGTNAHIIIEEYKASRSNQIRLPAILSTKSSSALVSSTDKSRLIILSAKTQAQLAQQVSNLVGWLKSGVVDDSMLTSVAYTLQIGREAFDYRLGIITTDIYSLTDALSQYQYKAGVASGRQYRCGSVNTTLLLQGDGSTNELQRRVTSLIRDRKLEDILEVWIEGITIDWEKLYGEEERQRISLPTYPFLEEHYWLGEVNNTSMRPIVGIQVQGLNPLLHENVSSYYGLKYSSLFIGNELFFADHIVHGIKVLPAVAHLEMARAAMEQALTPSGVVELGDVIWLLPVSMMDKHLSVFINLHPKSAIEIGFEIYTIIDGTNEKIICSRGIGKIIGSENKPTISISVLEDICKNQPLSVKQIYSKFGSMGLQYGLSHQTIVALKTGIDDDGKPHALVTLKLLHRFENNAHSFRFHPGLLDGALQALLGLSIEGGRLSNSEELWLPFSLESVALYQDLPMRVIAWLSYSKDAGLNESSQKIDIRVGDESGKVYADFKGLTLRVLPSATPTLHNIAVDDDGIEKPSSTVLLRPNWVISDMDENEIPTQAGEEITERRVMLVGNFTDIDVKAIELSLTKYALSSTENKNTRVIHIDSLNRGTAIAINYQKTVVDIFLNIKQLMNKLYDKKRLMQVVIQTQEDGKENYFSGLSGLLKTASQENPRIITQCIEIPLELGAHRVAELIEENTEDLLADDIRYITDDKKKDDVRREVRHLEEIHISNESISNDNQAQFWPDQGVCLVTGGLGGLGVSIAKAIGQCSKNAVVILTGRSTLSSNQSSLLDELAATGVTIDYQQCDVTNREAMQVLFAHITSKYGTLTSIIHCAGVTSDNFILNKSIDEIDQVVAPKVIGITLLDELSKDMHLEYFICFSSIASAVGNAGQADYAAANGFMDVYVKCRNTLVISGERHGNSISINWPLWTDGGMQIDQASYDLMRKRGLESLNTEMGIGILRQIAGLGLSQVVVWPGKYSEKIQAATQSALNRSRVIDENEQPELLKKTQRYFKYVLSETLKIDISRLDSDAPLESYGMDSVMAMNLTTRLECDFGSLSKTLFFEINTIRSLSEHFICQYSEELLALFRKTAKEQTPSVKLNIPQSQKVTGSPTLSSVKKTSVKKNSSADTRIAVIGLSGCYPYAENVDELWEVLKSGKDCITEVPSNRWLIPGFYESDMATAAATGASYSKWGGFIEDIDQLDPEFFNISLSEAKSNDIHTLVFLQQTWNLFENAGYTRDRMRRQLKGNVGVYIGAMICPENALSNIKNTMLSDIANRVSYCFGLSGPSIALDTMCSSSTVAIHLACKALQQRECEMAIAGGINLLLHPGKFVGSSEMGILASHPNSRSFSDGDGHLLSEAAGCVLLKSVSKAREDNDLIQAIISASTTIHSGHTNGYRLPDTNKQFEVIRRCLSQADIQPSSIGYIETASSGSALGDPIEFDALLKVFKNETDSGWRCSVGSIKSNIGHPEGVSGVAQLTKVILQLRHRCLFASIKAEPFNPRLNINQTPFKVLSTLQDWEVEDNNTSGTRIALINSFGAGGSYASLVVEEYINDKIDDSGPNPIFYLIPLSARGEIELRKLVKNTINYLENNDAVSLLRFSYTLQTARESMGFRLSVVVENIDELTKSLKSYLNDDVSMSQSDLYALPFVYTDSSKNFSPSLKEIMKGNKGDEFIQSLFEDSDLEKLASYWVIGGDVRWHRMYKTPLQVIAGLPNYPFKKIPLRYNKTNNKNDAGSTEIKTPLEITDEFNHWLSSILGVKNSDFDKTIPLSSLGFNSLGVLKLRYYIENKINRKISNELLSVNLNARDLFGKVLEEVECGPKTGSVCNKSDHLTNNGRTLEALYPKIICDPDALNAPFPLTDIQTAFLAGRSLGIGGDFVGCHIYNEFEVVDLDLVRLNDSWNTLLERHPMLRVRIQSDQFQKISKKTKYYKFNVTNISNSPPDKITEIVEALRRKMSAKIYKVEESPLYEIRIVRLPNQVSSVLMSIDEWVVDAHSIYILINEWQRLYNNPYDALKPLKISFRDYMLAVKEFESGTYYPTVLRNALEYYKFIPSEPNLPVIDDKSAELSHKRKRLTFEVGREEWANINTDAKSVNASTSALLITVFTGLLKIWSKSDEFSFAITTYNRVPLHHDIDNVIGPFMSTQIFIAKDNADKTFLEEVLVYDQQLISLSDFSQVSGVRLTRELMSLGYVAPDFTMPIVFTSLLNLDTESSETAQNNRFKSTYTISQTPQVFLDHQAIVKDGILQISWDVADGLYRPGLIDEMFKHYTKTLSNLSARSIHEYGRITMSEILDHSAHLKEDEYINFGDNDKSISVRPNPGDRFKEFPLTTQQQAYSFGRNSHLKSTKDSCQLYTEYMIRDVDVERLELAWSKVLQRHPALVTEIYAEGYQKVMDEPPIYSVKIHDLREMHDSTEIGAALLDKRAEINSKCTPLGEWPFFSIEVSLLPDNGSVTHFAIDMLVADGASISLIVRDWFNVYFHNMRLEPLDITFRDYVLAIEGFRRSDKYQHHLNYWKSKFDGCHGGPRITRKTINTDNFRRARITRKHLDIEPLKTYALHYSIPLDIVLLAIYIESLAAFAGSPSFEVVVPAWQREGIHDQINEVVGDFTSMSWIPAVTEECSFLDKCRKYNDSFQSDMKHKCVNGIEALRYFRDSHGRTLNYPFVFTSSLENALEITIEAQQTYFASKTAGVNMDHMIDINSDSLTLHWDVQMNVYPEGVIQKIVNYSIEMLKKLSKSEAAWVSLPRNQKCEKQ